MKTLCRILLFFALAWPLQAHAQLNTNRIMMVGRNALMYEDYVLSIQYFNRVINVKPYLPEPYYFRAIAKYYLDDLNGAAADCSIALGINPFLINAYNLHGIIMLRQGRSADALSDFNKGLAIEANDLNLLLNRAAANINLKKYDDAIADCNSVQEFDKRNTAALLYCGIALVQKGDSIQALTAFNDAAQINRYSPDAFTYKGMLLFQLGRYAEAIDAYNHLAELRPREANVFVNRAVARYRLDDFVGAFADLDTALALDPRNPLAYANRGMLRAEVGDIHKAIDDFSHLLALDPQNDIAIFNRSLLYAEAGNYANAQSDLNVIIARHPDFGQAYYQRAIVRRALGDLKGSELDYLTAYSFEQERLKRGLALGENANNEEEKPDETEPQKTKRQARSKNDRSIQKYDQMVVVADFGDHDDKLHQEKETIRGQIQHRDVAIDLEPVFELSFFSADTILQKNRYYERCVDRFNQAAHFHRPLLITNREYTADSQDALQSFTSIRDVSSRIDSEKGNDDLLVVRGTLYNLVMNYSSAINDFSTCIQRNPLSVNALFNRAAARYKMTEVMRSLEMEQQTAAEVNFGRQVSPKVQSEITILDYELIMDDLQKVLDIEPEFEFAYYNMSLVQCLRKNYTEAIASLDKALKLNEQFAEAYFNRGIIKIFLGEEESGTADLSKAGELGIFKAYNVIKRYTKEPETEEDE